MPTSDNPAILSQGTGYGIVIGFGAIFALAMWWLAHILAKFHNEVQGSEMYMTAKREIGTGLISSAVVSSWTVTATLLTSTSWAYSCGVSGAYFYGAGASVQIFVFCIAAIEFKRRAPGAHTFLEVAKIRYGKTGHIIFTFYSTLLCVISDVNILIGGSAVFTALTGMNVIAGVWLIPIGVVIYTLTGGIKATILTDYSHTIIIYALILAGLFLTYVKSDILGSPDKVYELLTSAATTAPVSGNEDGQYLTMRSQSGVLLGVVFWCACFGSTIDVAIFQKAITAAPAAALPGYTIGGLAWCAIPFCLATTFGLAARALEGTPAWPTYPRALTAEEVSQGLPLPYAAQALMGKGGAAFVLLMTFMACTAGFSSDLVSIAAVYTYDIYGTYINRNATGGKLLRMSHLAVVVWSICIAIIATGLTYTSIGVSYLITCMGVFTGCCVFPFYATVLWSAQNKAAIIVGPILGSIGALACWFASAYALEGTVTIASTSTTLPLVVGNGVSLISGCVYSILCTFLFGRDNFDWSRFQAEILVRDDSDIKGLTAEQLAEQLAGEQLTPDEERTLRRGKTRAIIVAFVLCSIFVLLIPMPMYGSKYVFSRQFFRGWVVVTFLWAFAAGLIITLLPLYEGRKTILLFFRFLLGKQSQSTVQGLVEEQSSDQSSPVMSEKVMEGSAGAVVGREVNA